MSLTTQLRADSRAVSAPLVASNRLSDFFRYHGIWAPGVRLFRAIGFQAKAWIIATTFIVPMAVLSWGYLSSQSDQIAFSAKERVGLVYAREAMPLLALLQKQRQGQLGGASAGASAESGELKGQIDAQLAKLDQVEKTHGESLGTSKAYASFLEAGRALKAHDKASHTAYIQSLIDLLGVATDGSNLTLDPDIDT